jgi:hypothetical protein
MASRTRLLTGEAADAATVDAAGVNERDQRTAPPKYMLDTCNISRLRLALVRDGAMIEHGGGSMQMDAKRRSRTRKQISISRSAGPWMCLIGIIRHRRENKRPISPTTALC